MPKKTPNKNNEYASATSNRYPEYSSHLLFRSKNIGDSKTLTGKVVITVVFLNDAKSKWAQSDIEDFRTVQIKTTEKFTKEANRYGVNLSIKLNYVRSSISETVDLKNFYSWIPEALKNAQFPNKENISNYLKTKFSAKEAPVFFAINREGRSYAVPSHGFEYGVLYKAHGDYRHELLHLFGAVDFYFPDALEDIAKKYFPNSIMITGGDVVVDPFTAYLVGWTNLLSDDSKRFVDETAWITQEYIEKAHKQEVVTGVGTLKYDDGVYVGDLVEGVPHGKGRVSWNNGDFYEGDWIYGAANGFGKLVWKKSGAYYVGYWKNWKFNGFGTYYYSNGSTLTGEWENGEYKN